MNTTDVPGRREDRPDTDDDRRRLLFDLRPTPSARRLHGVSPCAVGGPVDRGVILALFPIPWWWLW
jgi:hypothetical protein